MTDLHDPSLTSALVRHLFLIHYFVFLTPWLVCFYKVSSQLFSSIFNAAWPSSDLRMLQSSGSVGDVFSILWNCVVLYSSIQHGLITIAHVEQKSEHDFTSNERHVCLYTLRVRTVMRSLRMPSLIQAETICCIWYFVRSKLWKISLRHYVWYKDKYLA